LTDSRLRFPNQPLFEILKARGDIGRKRGVERGIAVHFAMSL